MKFSIVITLYKGARFIEATLDAVSEQTYKDYEVILVNDGSPDNVGEVAKRYMAEHPDMDFVYIEQKNTGLGGARNAAIRRASGDVIAILDQDDIWYPKKLEDVAHAYEKHPDDHIVCHNLYMRKDGAIKATLLTGPHEKDMHRRLLFRGNCLAASATSFKKSIVDRIGYFSEEVDKLHMVEDYEYWLRMALHGYRIFFMNDVLGEYVVHGDNFSHYELICKGELWVVNSHYKLLKGRRPIDYFRLRKRRAESLLIAAYQSFFPRCVLRKGVYYLSSAIANNPFLVFRLLKRVFKRNSIINEI